MRILLLTSFFIYFLSYSSGVPLNSTIMIFNDYDLEKCEERVELAFAQQNTKIHLVPTVYAQVSHRDQLEFYYHRDREGKLQELKVDYIDYYHQKLSSCVKHAYQLGLEVYITPHVDDKSTDHGTRLQLIYSPLRKYRGVSFYNLMFSYLGKLNRQIQKKIYLSIIGETGSSLYFYTYEYGQILRKLPRELNIGLSVTPVLIYGHALRFKKIPFIDEFDFIGVSAYYPIMKNCSQRSFERAAQSFKYQVRRMGRTRPVRLHFTEVGIGGSMQGALLSSLFTYKGVYGAYNPRNDPWKKKDNLYLRRKYYQCLLKFLENTSTIQAAFIWNSDSWDVQGFYPYSKKYRDNTISSWIREHNISSLAP